MEKKKKERLTCDSDNATATDFPHGKTMEIYAEKVECEARKFYSKNPLENLGEIQEVESMRSFIEERLYPMPPYVENPICWSVRCDYIFKDYVKLFGYPLGQEKTEPVFWAIAKRWIPELRAIHWFFDMTLVKENELRQKILYFWKEETYELRDVGYNGCHSNSWLEAKRPST